MHIIWTILIGFVVGVIAKLLTPGAAPSGFFLTAALGIIGSLVATYGATLSGSIPRANRQDSSAPSLAPS